MKNYKLKNKEIKELNDFKKRGFKYIARHQAGAISVFKEKPERRSYPLSFFDTWGLSTVRENLKNRKDLKCDYDFIKWENEVLEIETVLNNISK